MGRSKQGAQRVHHYPIFEWFFHLPLAEGSACHAELVQRLWALSLLSLSHTGENTAGNSECIEFAECSATVGPR